MSIQKKTKIKMKINSIYKPLMYDDSRYMVCFGGAGSGKSVFHAQKIILRILTEDVVHTALVLRKTQPSARKSVFALFRWIIREEGLYGIVKENKTEMTFTFPNGSQIICGGMDDPEKIKSIHGITVIWLEEATEFTIDDYRQVDLRLRGETGSYKQIGISFNPISKMLWPHKVFFENIKEDSTVLKTTYKDNAFLDDDYVKVLLNLEKEDENYYRIYALGEWGELKNIIYNKWSTVKEFPEACSDIFYGMDFGFNNPSALVKIGVHDENVYLQELLYASKLTNTDLIDECKRLIDDRSRIIYADSAEPDRITEFRNAGFMIRPANKSVTNGVDFVKRYHLNITDDSTNIIKEIQGYKYKEDKDGNVFEIPVKFNDHSMDAVRYGLYTHLGELNPIPTIRMIDI